MRYEIKASLLTMEVKEEGVGIERSSTTIQQEVEVQQQQPCRTIEDKKRDRASQYIANLNQYTQNANSLSQLLTNRQVIHLRPEHNLSQRQVVHTINPNRTLAKQQYIHRVAWTQGGFASIQQSQFGYQIKINKVITHNQLHQSCKANYSSYLKEQKAYNNHLYSIPFNRLLSHSQPQNNLTLNSLNLQDNIDEEVSHEKIDNQMTFPSCTQFMNSIVHSYIDQRTAMNSKYDGQVEQEMDYMVILNILFGNRQLDLQQVIKEVQGNLFREPHFLQQLNKPDISAGSMADKYVLYYLSNFLKKMSHEMICEQKERVSGGSLEEQLLTHIAGNNLQHACQLAYENNLPILALMISGSQNGQQRDMINNHMMDYSGITEYKSVYQALGGQIIGYAQLDITWLQVLGVSLWYQQNTASTLQTVLEVFSQNIDMDSIKIYQDNQQQPRRYPNLIYSLLRLSNEHCYLEAFLDDLHQIAMTSDALDTKQIWLVFNYLLNNSGIAGIKSNSKMAQMEKTLVRLMTDQMETVGMWWYACMVISYARDIPDRQIRIQSILDTHYDSTRYSKSEDKDIRHFLLNQLAIPEEQLWKAQGIHFQKKGQLKQAIDCYQKASDLNQVDYILSQSLGVSIVIQYWRQPEDSNNQIELEYLHQILESVDVERHKIVEWKKGSGYLKKIVKRLKRMEGSMEGLARGGFYGGGGQMQIELQWVVNQMMAMASMADRDRDRETTHYQGLQMIHVLKLKEKHLEERLSLYK